MAPSLLSSTRGISAKDASKKTRRSAAKSRQGCSRCKGRRVKCDERRPACGNCAKLGFQCPGFHQSLRWSTKHEQSKPPSPAATSSQLIRGPNTELESIDSGSEHFRDETSLIHELVPRGLSHLSTMLVEHWFRQVCPMRSTFDSEVNYNRQLALGTWTTSETVFLTLQAMSAACVAETMPHIAALMPSLALDAVTAIKREIGQIRSSKNPEVTVDLLFATFALGTSVHWMNTPIPEHEWLDSARELLALWKTAVSPMYAMLQAHFRQALTYWEMCLTASGDGSVVSRQDRKLRQYREKVERNLLLLNEGRETSPIPPLSDASPSALWSTRPNSWCGVSDEIIHYFGEVLALSRRARSPFEAPADATMPIDMDMEAFCNISIAQQLQSDLLSLDFSNLVLVEESQGFYVQTQDMRTPINHLVATAEAYRQAALLHLYMTFDNSILYPDEVGAGLTTREQFVLEKALHLVAALREIPVDSGSSSIHPILYLSVAATLKLDTGCETSTTCLQESKVIETRGFVLERLQCLQQMLPHRSSARLVQLAKALWVKYDGSLGDLDYLDWADVSKEMGWELVVLR